MSHVKNTLGNVGLDGDNPLELGGTVTLDGTLALNGDVTLENGADIKAFSVNHLIDFSDTTDDYLVVPYAGTITEIVSVLNTALAGGGGEDISMVFRDATGAMNAQHVFNGPLAEGTLQTTQPTQNNVFSAPGQFLRIVKSGSGPANTKVGITFNFVRV